MTTSLYQATYAQVYPGFATFPYYGHLVLYYLDYLDTVTQETLVAVPGGSYSMTPVNSRAGLTIPPPDGRWVAPGFGPMFLRPRFSITLALAALAEPAPQPTLHEIRALAEKSRAASGWYEPKVPPQPRPAPSGSLKPAPVPQPSQMQATRAQLEQARAAHGHYAPGGCKTCMSGGRAA